MQWLVGGQIYDVIQGRFSRQVMALDNGVIEALENEATPDPDDEVFDLAGAYLLPGLIDCHVHLTLNPDASAPSVYGERSPQKIQADTLEAARATLLGGITTVRDCGGWDYVEMAVREEVEAGRALGPRMVLSGKLLWVDTPAAHDYPGMFEIAGTAGEMRAAAARQLARGADFIKVMATGISTLSSEDEGGDDCYYGIEDLRALVEFAHERQVKVACHAEGLQGIRNVVEAGTDSVEHGTFAEEEVLRLMAKKGTYVVPTCLVMSSCLDVPELRERAPDYLLERFQTIKPIHSRAINAAYRLHVPIAMGTDAGAPGVFHGSNAQEIYRMVRDTGLEVEDAIAAATINAADLIDHKESVGSLEPGKKADIIAVQTNPLDDPAVFKQIAFVMKDGQVVKNVMGRVSC